MSGTGPLCPQVTIAKTKVTRLAAPAVPIAITVLDGGSVTAGTEPVARLAAPTPIGRALAPSRQNASIHASCGQVPGCMPLARAWTARKSPMVAAQSAR